jgi:hypothetical protein
MWQTKEIWYAPVVLGSDVDFVGEHVLDRLVVTSVTELELVCLATCSPCEKLVSETDTENRGVLRDVETQFNDNIFS